MKSRPIESNQTRGSGLARLAKIGASAQAAIPGLYAWATTVAPVAWSPEARFAAKIIAAIGVVALVTAPILEIAEMTRLARALAVRGVAAMARLWSIWGFVLSSAIVWVLVPSALSPVRFDSVRGVLGIVGWALFAFASAGPPLRADPNLRLHVASDGPLEPRSKLVRGDGVYVGVGVIIALCMQMVGWEPISPERAVLVRLVTLASAMAVVGAMTSLAVARHSVRVARAHQFRLRRSLPWIATTLLLAASGVLLWLMKK